MINKRTVFVYWSETTLLVNLNHHALQLKPFNHGKYVNLELVNQNDYSCAEVVCMMIDV